jgi:RNA polymerase sigma-70 factor (sigma-E family)
MEAMAVRPPEEGLDLEGLFRAHATPLLRLAIVLTGDHGLAEELVQEAFVRLHRATRPPAPGAERAYLRRTMINLSHGHHRHLRVVRRRPPDRAPDGVAAEVDVVRRDGQRLVAEAIRSLPRRQRDCIVLRCYEELSDTEIADVLGLSPGSVKTHLHRARATLADRLEALR